MRVLIIGPEEHEAIARVLDYAAPPHRWYYPGKTPIPGDDPRYAVRLGIGGSFYCVYSVTVVPRGRFRMLSISVSADAYPHPMLAFEIATAFGFTGYKLEDGLQHPGDWIVESDDSPRPFLMVSQPL